jgi:hypothetical protein
LTVDMERLRAFQGRPFIMAVAVAGAEPLIMATPLTEAETVLYWLLLVFLEPIGAVAGAVVVLLAVLGTVEAVAEMVS